MTQELYETTGTIEKGALTVTERRQFEDTLHQFADGPVLITIEATTEKALRSLQANRFQWKVFELIAAETGHTKDDIHDWMCQKFLTRNLEVIDKETGEIQVVEVTRGTSRLTKKEHTEFLDHVLLWAGEFLGMEMPTQEPA